MESTQTPKNLPDFTALCKHSAAKSISIKSTHHATFMTSGHESCGSITLNLSNATIYTPLAWDLHKIFSIIFKIKTISK